MTIIGKNAYQRYFEWAMLLFAFVLPLSRVASTVPLLLLVLLYLLDFNWQEKIEKLKRYKIGWLYYALFFAYAIGAIYSENMANALGDLNVKLPLFVLPFILLSADVKISKEIVNKVFKALLFGVVIACLLSYVWMLYNWFQSREISFYYTELTSLTNMHPTYLALYINSSLFYIFYRLFLAENRVTSREKIFFLFAVPLLFVTLILLSARMQLLLFVLLFNFSWLYALVQKKNWKFLFLLLLGNFAIVFALWNSDFTKQRFQYLTSLEFEFDQKSKWNGSSVRLAQWSCAVEVIKENLIFGVGTGDADQALLEKYKEKNFIFGLEKKYNAHNQYLQTFMAIGILGFLLLVSNFLTSLYLAFQTRTFLFGILILLISLNCLVENMFNLQAGLMFFAFFNAVFLRFSLEKIALKE